MFRSRAHAFVVVGSAVWCLAIVAAPAFPKITPIYKFFAAICHQDPGRSFHFFGSPLPVCIRCAAIYFGFLAGAIGAARPSSSALKLALAATLGEFALGHLLYDSYLLRMMTGVVLGWTAAPFIILGVEEMVRERIRRWNGAVRDGV